MRTPSAKTQSTPLATVITDTLKLWRRHHLTYDQTRYVAKEVRRAMAIARPLTRQRVITRLSRVEEERLIGQAYRMPGVRGLAHQDVVPDRGARLRVCPPAGPRRVFRRADAADYAGQGR